MNLFSAINDNHIPTSGIELDKINEWCRDARTERDATLVDGELAITKHQIAIVLIYAGSYLDCVSTEDIDQFNAIISRARAALRAKAALSPITSKFTKCVARCGPPF